MMPKFSVKRPYTVIVGIIAVILLGIVSLTKMSADLLPSMDFQYAVVVTTYPGASPQEVEETVTSAVESSVATVSNFKSVNSVSQNSISLVICEFEQDANMDSVTLDMRESLDQITSYWDDSISNPIIMKINPDMMPIIMAAVDVDGMDAKEITEYVSDTLSAEIESLEGVASVTTMGGIEENIEVTMNDDKIDALNKKIEDAITEQFEDAQSDLSDAKSKITSGQSELEKGKTQLTDQTSSTQTELNSKKIELYKQQQDLEEQLSSLQENETTLENAIASLQETKSGLDTIDESITSYQALIDQGLDTDGQLAAAVAGLTQQREQITSALTEQGISPETLDDAIAEQQTNLVTVKAGIKQLQTALEQVESGRTSIDDALTALNKSQLMGAIDIASSSAELSSAESELDSAQETLDSSKESAIESASVDNVLSVDTLSSLLVAQNFDMPAGYASSKDGTSYLVKVGDDISSIDELKDVVLLDMNLDGIDPIKLSDVADVNTTDNSDEVYAKVNGNSAIVLSIEKQSSYSTGDVTDRVNDKFDALMKSDDSLHVTTLMDQGVYIDLIVDSVMHNMIYGAILAVIILLLFLKDIRPTIVIAFSIPISVIFAIVLMYFTGISFNIISLSGLALGIGMLVDNSIVVIENIYRIRGGGIPPKQAAIEGAKQVTGAIAASTLTTICVFAPIVFTEGITRQLFVDMGLTIAYSLIASLIVALTLVPMMGAKLLKHPKEQKHPFFDRVQSVYGALLAQALRFKPVVFLLVILLLVGSVKGALSNGTAFMPDMESTEATVTITPPDDAEFEDAAELSDTVIERLSDIEDIETIGALIGSTSSISLSSSSSNAITMYLILSDDKELTNVGLEEAILERTSDLDCDVSVSTSSMDLSVLGGSGISINVKGRDLDTLQSIATDIADLLHTVEGTCDISDGQEESAMELRISVDKEKAASYGMTVAQVYQLVYAKMADSSSATTVSTDIKDYDVYVQTEEQSDITINEIKKMTFPYTEKDGDEEIEKEIPLKKIATFTETEGLSSINRTDQTRYISVSAGIDNDHNIGLVSNEVQKLLDGYDLPDGYTLEMTGEDETINDAMEQLMLMLILAIALIYLIMVAQFQSFLSPFIIMFTIPLAFTGGFLGLYFAGMEVSVIAVVGFVMLSGIIVNNGIVLVDYINQLRRLGMDKKEAIIQAGQIRIRPILMTALTTILGLSTMALGIGNGSDMVQPMAVVTIGGLIYGTLLTLIVVPCIYDLFNRNKSLVDEEWRSSNEDNVL